MTQRNSTTRSKNSCTAFPNNLQQSTACFICGKTPQISRIIHGCQYTTVTFRLTDLLRRVRLVRGRVADQQTKAAIPPLALNKHCAECEFQSRCRQIAMPSFAKSKRSAAPLRKRSKPNGAPPRNWKSQNGSRQDSFPKHCRSSKHVASPKLIPTAAARSWTRRGWL